MRKLRAIPTVAGLAGALLMMAAAPVHAASPGASFTLTIHDGQSVLGPVVAQVTLTCHPAGGTHPHAAAACQVLDQAKGDFTQIQPAQGQSCIQVFAPVTVEAIGSWDGTPEHFVHTYGNRCFAAVDTNHVFDF